MNRGQLGDSVGSSNFAMEIGIVRANRDQSPISRKVFPWTKIALEAHALGDLKCSDDSICLPAAEMEGNSAPQTPARRTNEHESSVAREFVRRTSDNSASQLLRNAAMSRGLNDHPTLRCRGRCVCDRKSERSRFLVISAKSARRSSLRSPASIPFRSALSQSS
jgi:hypothetical protein